VRKILILGGTRDALQLAALLHDSGLDVTTSLAGATSRPETPKGAFRIGGFGGVDGLAAYAGGFDLIADASHPFAAQISAHAHAAAARIGIPYVRLERPAWEEEPGDLWTVVANIAAAAEAIPRNARILLTIGRRDIAPFIARPDLSGVVRMIEAPADSVPAPFSLHLAKPPFTIESERAMIAANAITHLVTKNSGGALTRAKIAAARETATPVIMIARPVKPAAETAVSPEDLLWLIAASRERYRAP
jgi:precorrin-6A/cobalt-precorrin-6A reductase